MYKKSMPLHKSYWLTSKIIKQNSIAIEIIQKVKSYKSSQGTVGKKYSYKYWDYDNHNEDPLFI
jgi:hypothetical protein